jgi:general stress protein YciG
MNKRENSNENMTVQEAGRKGGEARAEKYSPEELSEQARRGAETIEKKQPGFHAEIGQKGGQHSHGGQNRESR